MKISIRRCHRCRGAFSSKQKLTHHLVHFVCVLEPQDAKCDECDNTFTASALLKHQPCRLRCRMEEKGCGVLHTRRENAFKHQSRCPVMIRKYCFCNGWCKDKCQIAYDRAKYSSFNNPPPKIYLFCFDTNKWVFLVKLLTVILNLNKANELGLDPNSILSFIGGL